MPATLVRDVTWSQQFSSAEAIPIAGGINVSTPKGDLGLACQHPLHQPKKNIQRNRLLVGLRKGLNTTIISDAQKLLNPVSDISIILQSENRAWRKCLARALFKYLQ